MDVQMEYVYKMIKQKRGMSAWIWVVIILVVIGVGVGLYFLLTGGSDGGSSLLGRGSSIPQPPALPSGHGNPPPIANGGNSIPQPPALPSG